MGELELISALLSALLVAFIIAFVVEAALSAVLTKAPSFARIYTYAFLFVFILLVIALSTPRASPGSVASHITSNLRGMQEAAQLFYAANRDILSEIPRDTNIVEYLEQYLEHPFGLSNDGPNIFIISDNHWWVGHRLGQSRRDRRATHELRRRLTARASRGASSVGLFGSSEFAPPVSADVAYHYNMDDFVWMFVREVGF